MIPFAFHTLVVTLIAACLASTANAAPSYNIKRIDSSFDVAGLNNNGQVIGNHLTGPSDVNTAASWANGKTTSVYDQYAYAWAINDHSAVAGSLWGMEDGNDAYRAAVFQNGTATVLHLDGMRSTYSAAINNAGQAIVNGLPASGYAPRSYLYTPGEGMIDLTAIGGMTNAYGMNEQGTVVGLNYDYMSGRIRASMYTNGQVRDIGAPDQYSGADAVNDSNVAVGFSGSSPYESNAVMFVDGQTVALGSLGGQSEAYDINSAGDILGWSGRSDGSFGYFLYHAGTMTDLDTFLDPADGSRFVNAAAINNAGQIVGTIATGGEPYNVLLDPVADHASMHATMHTAMDAAMVLSPIPEPAAYALLLVGVAVCAARRPRPGLRRTA